MVAVELPEGAGQGQGGAMSQYNGVSAAAGSFGAPAIILDGIKLSGLKDIASDLADELKLTAALRSGYRGGRKYRGVFAAQDGSEHVVEVHALNGESDAYRKELAERFRIRAGCTRVRAEDTVIPDYAVAKQHLALLDGGKEGGKFTFYVADDNKKRKRAREQAGHYLAGPSLLYGTFAEHAEILTKYNQRGEGVFVTVNRSNSERRRAKDIVAVRAMFVDLDGAPIEPVLACEYPPDFVIESSRRKYHAYWLNSDGSIPLDPAEFRIAERKLIAKFGGDQSACDVSRVLRLAGFWHQKVDEDGVASAPFMSRIIHVNKEAKGRAAS
jgi:hypothetical protein